MRKTILALVFSFHLFMEADGQSPKRDNLPAPPSASHTLLVFFSDSLQAPEAVPGSTNKNGRTEYRSRNKRLQEYLLKIGLIKAEKAFPAAAELGWHPVASRLLNYYLLTFESDADSVLNSMKRMKFPFAQAKGIYKQPAALYDPDDYFNMIPGNLLIPKSSALEFIGARTAWDITKGSQDIKIGISDILFDSTCAELSSKAEFLPGINFRDGGGHGTRVACIAAGATDNGEGLSAIGFNCRMICTNQDYNGILRAVAKGAKVINCSWGDTLKPADVNPEYRQIIDLVTSLGVTVVASAGNYQPSAGKYYFPAGFENVISVSSVGHVFDIGSPNRYWWKDVHDGQIDNPRNETFVHDDQVDICAPGYGVYSTGGNNVYNNGWGTSFSSPFVAGTAGLIYSICPSVTPNEVQEILKCTAVPVDGISYNQDYVGKLGAGRLDAGAAVALAKSKLSQPKPQDIIWNGEEAGVSRVINPSEILNFSTLRFTVADVAVPTGATYSWIINSYNKIIYKTGPSVTVTLTELGLKKGGGCAHLEVGVRRGVDCSASYYYFEKQLCAKADFEKVIQEGSSCARFPVYFFNKSVDGQTFRWDFGDGNSSTEVNPVYYYSSPGKKYIKLTVNGTAVKRDSIELKAGSFLVNGRSDNVFFCESQPVSFYYSPGDCGSTFSWNFGDGTAPSSQKNPVHIFPGKGPFKVALTVDDRFTYTQWLYGKPLPTDFEIKPSAKTCNNGKFSFSLQETGGCVSSCIWDFGNGSAWSGQNSAAINFTPGNYTVTARVNNTVTFTRQLKVGDAFPNFKYGSNNLSNTGEQLLLAGLPVLFNDLSVCATSYKWEFGDGTTSNLQNPEKSYLNPGNYIVKLTINDNILLATSRTINVGCGKASNLVAGNITKSAATLSWSTPGGTSSAILYFKKSSDKIWTIREDVTSPYVLTGLEEGARYTYFLVTQCVQGAATASDYGYFTTTSPCFNLLQTISAFSNLPDGSCGGATLQLNANQVTNAVYRWAGPNGYTASIRNPAIPSVSANNNGVYRCTVYVDACEVGSASVVVNVNNPPQPPSGLQILDVGGNSVKLNWVSNTPDARTDLQYKVKTSAAWATVTGVTSPFTLAGLVNNTTYSWQLKTDTYGCSGPWVTGSDFNTTRNCDPPLTNNVNNITDNSADISWSPAGNGVNTYSLYFKKDDPATTMTAFSSVTGSGVAIACKLTALMPNTRYEYRIFPKCMPGANLSAYYTGGFLTTRDCQAPVLKPVTGITRNSAILNWSNPASCLGMKVEIRPKGGVGYTLVQSKLSSSTQSLMLTGLAPGNEYEYRLTPFCGSAASGGGIGGTGVSGTFATSNAVCGNTTIQACTGSISDGSDGNNYNNNMTCSWTVTAPAGSALTLIFSGFNTEKDKDILKVYKGASPVAANLVGAYSGNLNPGVVTINSNSMYLSFTSNSTTTAPGWEAKFYSTVCPPPAQKSVAALIEDHIKSGLVNNITLYPNPYVDHVEIEMQQELENAELTLADEDGRIVYRKFYTLMERQVLIEFDETLPPADYTLTIKKVNEVIFRQSLISRHNNFTKTIEVSDNEILEGEINVFPNPYIDNFNIQVKKELKDVVLLMSDFQGRIVYRKDFRSLNGKTQIDLGATLPAGVYLLVLRDANKILVRKRVIAQK